MTPVVQKLGCSLVVVVIIVIVFVVVVALLVPKGSNIFLKIRLKDGVRGIYSKQIVNKINCVHVL
jgi:hypothetical protein